jgi:hypothetical protein
MERGRYTCPCQQCRRDEHSPTAEWHRAINEAVFHADEKNRRLVAGLEALRVGWGGIRKLSEITGLDAKTISRGIRELREGRALKERVRRPGGGRQSLGKKRPCSVADAQRDDER